MLFILSGNLLAEETEIIFINGIQNTLDDAIKSLDKIDDIISESENHKYNKKRFTYNLVWNPIGFGREKPFKQDFAIDVIELFLLKTAEEWYSESLYKIISPHNNLNKNIDKNSANMVSSYYEKMLPGGNYLQDSYNIDEDFMKPTKDAIKSLSNIVRNNERSIVIAHSQGNLLANIAYARIASELGSGINQKLRIINIANTAKIAPNNLNFTHSLDEALYNKVTSLDNLPSLTRWYRETPSCDKTSFCDFTMAPYTFVGTEGIPGSRKHSFNDTYLSEYEIYTYFNPGVEFTSNKNRFRDRFEDFVYTAEKSFLSQESLTVDTTHIPNPKSCTPYEHQLEAVGGTPPYKWSKAKNPNDAGTPTQPGEEPIEDRLGLSIDADGKIHGTPEKDTWNSSIDFEITAILEDSTGETISKTFDIDVEKAATDCRRDDSWVI